MSDKPTYEALEHRIQELEQNLHASGLAQESLKKNLKMVESLIDALPIPVCCKSISGAPVACNKALKDFFGHNEPDRSETILDLLPREFADKIRHGEAELLQTRQPKIYEGPASHADGAEHQILVKQSIYLDENGAPGGFIASVVDITEFRKIETALRESETAHRTLARNLPGLVYRVNLQQQNHMIFFNDMLPQLTGYTVEDLCKGQVCSIDPLIIPEDRPKVVNAVRRAVSENRPFVIEYRLRHRSGAIRHFYENGRPVYDPSAKPIFIDGVILDITDQKQTERRLQESEKNFRALLNAISESAFLMDVDGAILSANKTMADRFGKYPSELIGCNIHELLPSDLVEQRRKYVEQVRQTKRQVEFEDERNAIRFHHTMYPIFDSEGEVFRLAVLSIDITEKKLLEDEKKRLEEHFRNAQKLESIGTLAAGISHDFNNILGAIIGYAQMARMQMPKGDHLIDYLDEILKGCRRATELIKQILAFSRWQQQKFQPAHISGIVKETAKLLRAALPSTIEVRPIIQTDQDAIFADPTQIHQILMNLCTNAGHAMREKGGVLEIGLRGPEPPPGNELAPGNYAVLSVRDTGHGIAPELINRIFDPFFTTKRPGEGTGMGLAVVHGIAKSHGGTVLVESQIGKGTCFSVYLPLLEQPESQDDAQPSETIPTGKERILFVDDEISLAKLYQQLLTRLGYEVTAKSSSPEALEAFRRNPKSFDLIITDMTMPQMTGAELSREIFKIRPGIPIILCTGYSDAITPENALKIGIKAFMLKPLDLQNIAATIRRALKDKEKNRGENSDHR